MPIPFLDLKAQHASHRAEILASIGDVVDRCAFAGGPYVEKFEQEFAAFCRTGHAIGVANGTDALWFALLALGVGRGDEVITAPNSFIATAEAISFCGATPVFVDIDEHTYTLDPARLEGAITRRTKAIIPVHLYGQMADMDPIMAVAARHGLWVIEDACQAHGAEYRGRRAGSIGHLGCFSFYPGKNLGAWGEAGAVVTQDLHLAEKVRILRDHGQETKYHHSVIGWNGRMDGIQAAVLQVKLRDLDRGNAARRENALIYRGLLADVAGVRLEPPADHGTSVYHLLVVRVAGRDRVLEGMGRREIACGVHYPTPIHLQPAYAHLGLGPGSFPIAERSAREVLSLPMFPELTAGQIALVAKELAAVVAAPRLVEALGV